MRPYVRDGVQSINPNGCRSTRRLLPSGAGVSRNFALDVVCDSAYSVAAKRIAILLHVSRGAMSVSYAIIVADNVQSPSGSVIRPTAGGAAEYEAGHSERQATGWVAVGQESRWAATLAVP